MSDFELERSPEARELAEDALFQLLGALGAHDLNLVVLGGLVPELLTGGEGSEAPDHLGTTDIDIHLSLFADAETNVEPVEAALEAIGAEPDGGVDGWRWLIPSGGSRVRIEFLCDLEDQPEGVTVSLPGCRRLRAANLRGTGFVARDWAEEPIERVIEGETVTYQARFAGLEGYLLAKSYAARHRGAEKDYYDLVHVLLYNRAGGPRKQAPSSPAVSLRTTSRPPATSSARSRRDSAPHPTTPPRATSTRHSASIRKKTRHNSHKTLSAQSPNSSPPSTSHSVPLQPSGIGGRTCDRGAFMERRQPTANGTAPRTAQLGRSATLGNPRQRSKLVRNAMKKGLPGDRLRFVTGSYRRGGPFRCCTPVWISVASVSTSTCSRLTVQRSRSARRRPTSTALAV